MIKEVISYCRRLIVGELLPQFYSSKESVGRVYKVERELFDEGKALSLLHHCADEKYFLRRDPNALAYFFWFYLFQRAYNDYRCYTNKR